MSTSDEEDNDTESDQDADDEESSEEEKKDDQVKDSEVKNGTAKPKQQKGKKISKEAKKDVVYDIIERDPALAQRDLEARLLKIQLWKKLRRKYALLNEDYDVDEDFNGWWTYFDD